VSHALKEMRSIFNDPLFIQRAIHIDKMLVKGLSIIEQSYKPEHFDPNQDDISFSIIAPDFLN